MSFSYFLYRKVTTTKQPNTKHIVKLTKPCNTGLF